MCYSRHVHVRVFISYADADRKVAEKLAEALKSHGQSVWFDHWKLMPGEDWHQAIRSALQESNAMVVLMSKAAAHSRWVTTEIDFALGSASYKRRVVPVLLDDEAAEQMPWILRTFHSVQLISTSPGAIDDAAVEVARALEATG